MLVVVIAGPRAVGVGKKPRLVITSELWREFGVDLSSPSIADQLGDVFYALSESV